MGTLTLEPPTPEDFLEHKLDIYGGDIPYEQSLESDLTEAEKERVHPTEGGIVIEAPGSKAADTMYGDSFLGRNVVKPTSDVSAGVGSAVHMLTAPIEYGTAKLAESITGKDLDEDWFLRLMNPQDYEALDPIIPYVLAYGKGPRGTFTTAEQMRRGVGEGAALTMPFAAVQGMAARTAGYLMEHGVQKTLLDGMRQAMNKPWLDGGKTAAIMEMVYGGVSGSAHRYEEQEKPLGGVYTGSFALLSPLAIPLAMSSLATGITGISWAAQAFGLNNAAKYLAEKTLIAKGYNMSKEKIGEHLQKRKDEKELAKGEPSEKLTSEIEREAAAIQESILDNPGTAATTKRSYEIQEELEEYGFPEFTTEELSLDPNLLESSRILRGKDTPGQRTERRNRQYQQIDSVGKFVEDKIPFVTDGPTTVLNSATKRINSVVNRTDRELAEIETYTPEAQSQSVAGKLIENHKIVGGRFEPFNKDGRYEGRSAAGRDIRQDLEISIERNKQILEDYSKKEGLKATWAERTTKSALKDFQVAMLKDDTFKGIRTKRTIDPDDPQASLNSSNENVTWSGLPRHIQTMMKRKEPLSFAEWQDARMYTMNQLQKAMSHNDKYAIPRLAAYAGHLDNYGMRYMKGRGDEGDTAFTKFMDYTNLYRTLIKEPFGDGMLIRILEKDPSSPKHGSPIYKIPDEEVGDAILQGGTKSTTAWRKTVDDYPQTNERSEVAMRSIVLDRINRDIAKDQTTHINDSKKIDKIDGWVDKNEGVLKELGLWGEINASRQVLADIEGQLVGRNATLQRRREVIANSQLYKGLTSANSIDLPEQLFENALKNPALMAQLRKQAQKIATQDDDPTVMNSFNSAVFNAFKKTAPDMFETPAAARNFMDDPVNDRVLTSALGKEHVNNIKTVLDISDRIFAVSGATFLDKGVVIRGSNFLSVMEKHLGSSVKSISARLTAVAEKRISGKYAGTWLLGRLYSAQLGRKADMILERALTDPKLSKILATKLSDNTIIKKDGTIAAPIQQAFDAYIWQMGIPRLPNEGEPLEILLTPPEREKVVPPPPSGAVPKIIQNVPTPAIEPPPPNNVAINPAIEPPPPNNVAINPAQYGAMFPRDELGQAIAQQGVSPGGLGSLV